MKKILSLIFILTVFPLSILYASDKKELMKIYSKEMRQYKKENHVDISLNVDDSGYWYYVTTKKLEDGTDQYYILDKKFDQVIEVYEDFLKKYSGYEYFIETFMPKLKDFGAKMGWDKYEAWVSETGQCFIVVEKMVNGEKLLGLVDMSLNILIDCKYKHFSWYPEIKAGVNSYDTWTFTGGWDTFSIVDVYVPQRFEAIRTDTEEKDVYLTDGKMVGTLPSCPMWHYGSWIFTNIEEKTHCYVNTVDGIKTLVLTNAGLYNIGLYQWDGTELMDSSHMAVYIRDHNSTRLSYTTASGKNGSGCVILDDLSTLTPSVFEMIRTDFDHQRFLVKKDATDQYHVYKPGECNDVDVSDYGEVLYKQRKFKECIEYYSTADISDNNKKLYLAFAMYSLAINSISSTYDYVSDPERRARPKSFNYDENKELLETAIKLTEIVKQQDPTKTSLCEENIGLYRKGLGELDYVQGVIDYNSFGNQLLRGIQEGIVKGISQAAEQAVDRAFSPNAGTKQDASASSYSSGSTGGGNESSSSSSSNNEIPRSAIDRYNQLNNEIERSLKRIPNLGNFAGQEKERLQRYIDERDALKRQYGFK